MNFKKILAIGVGVALLAGAALAQSISIPVVAVVNPTDLIPIVPLGQPQAQSFYMTAQQITSQSGYYKSAPATGFTYTFGNTTTNASFRPAGTIAAGYVTLAPAPSDGDKACLFSSQQITALYIAANTGQSINNAINGSTLSANTGACYLYGVSNATWDRM